MMSDSWENSLTVATSDGALRWDEKLARRLQRKRERASDAIRRS